MSVSSTPSLTNVQLEQGGVYFFKAPIRVTTRLHQELLIVFTAPSIHSCGLVLLDSEMPQRVVEGMFDNLLKKIVTDLKVTQTDITLKVFGQSFRRRRSVRYIEAWSVANGIKIGVMDVGKNISRHVIVDCGSGRVGVSYAEGFTEEDPAFLTLGSVRLRETIPSHSHEILILTNNRVQRTLAKQAIEENLGFRANCPKNPIQIIALNDFREFAAEVVLVFEDLDQTELISTWMKNASKYYPNLKFCWVGKENAPAWLPENAKKLQPVEPETIALFKTALLGILPESPLALGRVIPFKK